ncbi:hypothetical protein DFH11DRAFT_1267183 [Phellopilus nigrolimitatus]|nr:hypothetical protein DFH11DRAFT_1267183 [Phellopilus nigrolimitatus]
MNPYLSTSRCRILGLSLRSLFLCLLSSLSRIRRTETNFLNCLQCDLYLTGFRCLRTSVALFSSDRWQSRPMVTCIGSEIARTPSFCLETHVTFADV